MKVPPSPGGGGVESDHEICERPPGPDTAISFNFSKISKNYEVKRGTGKSDSVKLEPNIQSYIRNGLQNISILDKSTQNT